jgi:hypothetical protein
MQIMNMALFRKNKRILFFGTVFAVVLFVFNLTDSFCDVGNCVRYKVELILDDGSQRTGYIQIVTYDPMIELDNSLFLTHLKKDLVRKNRDSFALYKRIQTIEFPKLEFQNFGFKYSAAGKNDTVLVNIERIKYLHLLDICGCEHGDFSEIKRRNPKDKFLIKYHHWIIDELTQWEIDMLQTKPAFLINRESPLSGSGVDSLFVLCYDNSISESKLNQLSSGLYLDISDDKAPEKELLERRIEHYNKVKEDLRRKKIITLIIKGYN